MAGEIVGPSGEVLFSSDFTVDTGGMALYQGDGVATVGTSGGEVGLQINAGGPNDSFWFDANEGVLLYVPIAGDFDAVAPIRVRNSADSGLPTVNDGNFRVAGLACHDPDRSVDLDYLHIGLGCIATADIQVEHKSTVASVSDFTAVAPAGASTGIGTVEIRRRGQLFAMYFNAALVHEYDRTSAPMPDVLQVGFVAYSNQAVHDIRLFASGLRITRA